MSKTFADRLPAPKELCSLKEYIPEGVTVLGANVVSVPAASAGHGVAVPWGCARITTAAVEETAKEKAAKH